MADTTQIVRKLCTDKYSANCEQVCIVKEREFKQWIDFFQSEYYTHSVNVCNGEVKDYVEKWDSWYMWLCIILVFIIGIISIICLPWKINDMD